MYFNILNTWVCYCVLYTSKQLTELQNKLRKNILESRLNDAYNELSTV